MNSNSVRRRPKSAFKQKRPTRRSRRLSGLPPASHDDKENGLMPNIIDNYIGRKRNIKTPQKRNIFSSNILNTTHINGEINYKQIEGVQTEIKPTLNIAKTLSIAENNVHSSTYIYNNKQNEESSDNEIHEEEEKSAILIDTPKEKMQINKVKNTNEMETKHNANNNYQFQITFMIFCIIVLHLVAWLAVINIKNVWFNWYNNYVGFTLSFILYTVCRYYYSCQTCCKNMERIYIKLNGIHSLFVLTNMFDCFLTVYCQKMPSNHELMFKSNEWITYGLFMSHFGYDLYNLYYNNNSNNKWLIFGRDAMIAVFLMIFAIVGDNAINLIFVYCSKALIITIMVNLDMFDYTVVKDLQLNIILIHFAAFFSILKAYN